MERFVKGNIDRCRHQGRISFSGRNTVKFRDLSATDAERYRVQVAADGPARLAELARLLDAAGVDLDAFDGTVRSLGPLWAWFLEFARADFPGIALDAVPRDEAVEPQGPEYARLGYAAELIAHYLFEVASGCFRDVQWVSYPRARDDSFQRVAVQFYDDDGYHGFTHPADYIGSVTAQFLRGNQEFADPYFLAESFLKGPFLCGRTTAERCRALPRGTSILAPLLSVPVPEGPEEQLVFFPKSKRAETGESPEDLVGDELLLAHRRADIEQLEKARPLKLPPVVATLVRLGFCDIDGATPTAEAILAKEFAEFVRDDDAMVTTLVAGGKLRSLQISAISPSAASWAEIVKAFTKIAARLGAKLAREDEF
jgi:hypothetical protein